MPEVNPSDFFNLKNKNIVVTGASSGIGLEVATAMTSVGANVAMWYNSHDISDLAEELSNKYNVQCKAYKCQITKPQEVKNVLNQVLQDFEGNKIDCMIANAGIAWNKGPLVDIENDDECFHEWDKIMDIDLNGCFYISRYIGQIFKKQGYGSLIFTASMSAHIVNVPQMQAGYNSAKAAILHLSKSLAVEWAGFARVNTISPGYINTKLTAEMDPELKEKWTALVPMKRLAQPEELIGAYIYLASNASSYTTGTDILVDGGYCAC
ncbi:hypothetical protein ACO0RG_000093 [Hanseniaspora osmophila]